MINSTCEEKNILLLFFRSGMFFYVKLPLKDFFVHPFHAKTTAFVGPRYVIIENETK